MGAVRRPECVVHINARDLCQFFGERGIIRLFLVVKPYVLQQQHVTRFHDAPCFFDLLADAIVRKRYVAAQQIRELDRHGP